MNTHDIELPPLPGPTLEHPTGDLRFYGEQSLQAYARAAIEPYAKRIAELEYQLEQIGAGGVDGRYLMGGRNNFEPPSLPEWLQEKIAKDTEYPVSKIVHAMRQYARAAIEADRKRAIKAIDARFRAALTASCPSDYSYQYYAGKADAYDIAWQIIKGALNE